MDTIIMNEFNINNYENLFISIFKSTLIDIQISNEIKAENIREFLTKYILGYINIHELVIPDELNTLTVNIFTDIELRRFILNIQYKFITRLNNIDTYKLIVEAISTGIALDTALLNNKSPIILTPESIYSRLPNYNELNNILLNNKWLTIIYLMNLFITTEVFLEMYSKPTISKKS